VSDRPLDRHRWWLILGAVALGGALLRVVYVVVVARHLPLGADATWYLLQRGSIFDGLGYVDPELLFRAGEAVPTANFPPLYPVYLVAVRAVAGDSETVAQLAGALTGALTVVLTGLLARRFTGATTALVAAGAVALCPALVAADGSLMSETLFVPLVVAAVLLAHLAGTGGGVWSWVGLGATCGLAALTRTEALLLVPLLVLPILWWGRPELRRRLVGALVALVALGAVVVPWAVRNARELGSFTISTVSPDTALAGANCDATYAGPGLGSWDYGCTRPELRRELGEQEWGRRLRAETRDHISEHPGRLPVVVVARELRVWGLWDPSDQVPREVVETRSEWFQWVAWVAGLVVLVGGVAGLAHLGTAGRRDVVVLWAPIAMVVLTAALTHGNTRFSAVAQPVLAVGVAVTVTTLARRGGAGARGRGDGRAVGPVGPSWNS
jgi:4-amino-4-deoxy-L-arabinose transferase-like glycosyltransferase